MLINLEILQNLLLLNKSNFDKSSFRAFFESVNFFLLECGYKISTSDNKRPWGGFFVIDERQSQKFSNQFFDGFEIDNFRIAGKLSPKILIIKPKSRLSWQYHFRREEIWRVFFGKVGVIKNKSNIQGKILLLNKGDQVKIKKKERHRLIGIDNFAIISEMWQHTDYNNPSNEDDIVRINDDFGRETLTI